MGIADTDPTLICCLILPSKVIRYGCEEQDLHGGIPYIVGLSDDVVSCGVQTLWLSHNLKVSNSIGSLDEGALQKVEVAGQRLAVFPKGGTLGAERAIRNQNGVKKGPAEFFVVDHIEHPSAN
jgi:hypothetical protein